VMLSRISGGSVGMGIDANGRYVSPGVIEVWVELEARA
jgi:hypothetical protein